MQKNKIIKGLTLIELLVVVAIIGILTAVSLFGLNGARASARDGKRSADLEQIRSGLEMFRSDCNKYPATLSTSLVGDGSTSSCLASNVYITSVPKDPKGSDYYYSGTTSTYQLCAFLEQGTGSVSCGGTCGGSTCNYKVTQP